MLSLPDPTRVLKNPLGTSLKIYSTTGCSMSQKNTRLNWMHCWMRVRSLWGATCLAQKKSEGAPTGRAGGEIIHPTMRLSLSCLKIGETLLLWRVAPHSSSLQTVLKQHCLEQKKWPGRELLL